MLFAMTATNPLPEIFKVSTPNVVSGGGILPFYAIYRGKNMRSAMLGDGVMLNYSQSIRAVNPDLLSFEMLKNRYFLEWRRLNVSQKCCFSAKIPGKNVSPNSSNDW
jgi:hypothetical protein